MKILLTRQEVEEIILKEMEGRGIEDIKKIEYKLEATHGEVRIPCELFTFITIE